MPRVFISHANADRAVVTQNIISLLDDHNVDLWFAEDDIATGRQWERSILEGLKSCDWFLVALTPRAIQSEWVKDEVHWAINERPGRIVPVLMEDCDIENIHIRLPRIQYVNFRTVDDQSRSRLLAVWGIEYRPTAQFQVRFRRLGDRYTIEEPIGSVDFLREFVGHDHILNRRVLIKAELQRDRQNLELEQSISTEVFATAILVHPAIPRVFDLASDEETGTYSVLEYIAGNSLRDLVIQEGPLTARSACDIMIPICRAVDYANERGIIHRNIKPNSIVLADSGHPYITNFILAKLPEMDEIQGTILGTPLYMAPEQCKGEDVDRRVDVWGLGVVLYELLTGRLPFNRDGLNDNIYSLFDSIIHTSPLPLRDHNKTIPRSIERICMKCLENDRSKRYSTAADLASDLETSIHKRARWWSK